MTNKEFIVLESEETIERLFFRAIADKRVWSQNIYFGNGIE
ncbi:MAG: hypothetical protein QXF76_03395 [Candidatus Anstonellales archaeon]